MDFYWLGIGGRWWVWGLETFLRFSRGNATESHIIYFPFVCRLYGCGPAKNVNAGAAVRIFTP